MSRTQQVKKNTHVSYTQDIPVKKVITYLK